METTEHKKWTLKPGGDLTLWVIAGILGVVSLLVVYSSTGAFAYGPGHIGGSHLSVLVRQMVIVAMGLVVIYLVHKVNYQFYGRIVWVAYVTALVFTILVYFIGEVNPEAPDAPRWIRIPIVNFTFQPSDFLKVATVMVVARESARRLKTISGESVFPPLGGIFAGRRTNPNTRTAVRRAARRRASKILRETTLPLFAPIVVACAAILPTNLSTTLILFGTCLVMLFIARMRTSDLLRFIALIAIAGAVVILPLALSGTLKRADTWTGRFERFFAGEKSYQVEQAEIAIASGGLTGRGAGESIQRANLPLAESDYAYAFIIEEYGSLIGGLVVLLLYLWIFFRGIAIFRKCGTAFPSMLVLGLALLITSQAFVNMMVSVDMIPSTGVTLPLISKGGSSELFLSFALGMMLGVSRQIQEQTLDKPKAETLLE